MEELRALIQNKYGTDRIRYASIGGSATWGMRFPEDLKNGEQAVVHKFPAFETPFGQGSGMKLIEVKGVPILRVTHQGWKYGTNQFPSIEDSLQVFWVLKEAGVEQIIVDGSGGGITARQGDVMVCHDFVDLYSNPITTTFARRIGVDSWKRLANPFCPRLRKLLIEEANKILHERDSDPNMIKFGRIIDQGVYVTTQPGLFESSAQIRWYKQLGGDMVGQSLGQVAKLARICDMCIASIHILANDAEGLPANWGEVDMREFYLNCAVPMGQIVWNVLEKMVTQGRECTCLDYSAQTHLLGLPVKGA
jgi:5'-methylthioadenosine phosphorylase